jgi:CXXC-20-CXXC protein
LSINKGGDHKVPTCIKCGNKFSWLQVQKNIWEFKGFFKGVNCNKCGSKYQVSYASGALASLLITLPFLIFGLFISTYSFLITAMIQLLIVLIITLFVPFLIRYDSISDMNVKRKNT